MSSRVRIKAGPVEFEYEGEAELSVSDIKDLFSHIETLFKVPVLAAVDVLYSEVVAHHLASFNAEAVKVNSKWKPAVNEDGLSRMGEADFLDRLAAIGVLGKNAKEELAKALKLRNGCGHPNSLKVGPNMVASHLETLILNVFEVFAQ